MDFYAVNSCSVPTLKENFECGTNVCSVLTLYEYNPEL